MAVTNLTGLYNTSTVYQIALFVNNQTNGVFFVMFIVSSFFILLGLQVKKYDRTVEKSVLLSSFLCFMLSITLVSLNLLVWPFMAAFAVIMIFAAFWVRASQA